MPAASAVRAKVGKGNVCNTRQQTSLENPVVLLETRLGWEKDKIHFPGWFPPAWPSFSLSNIFPLENALSRLDSSPGSSCSG